jgi:hypothetical protein
LRAIYLSPGGSRPSDCSPAKCGLLPQRIIDNNEIFSEFVDPHGRNKFARALREVFRVTRNREKKKRGVPQLALWEKALQAPIYPRRFFFMNSA